jgi:hypothetical protein
MSVIPALWKVRWKDIKYEANLGYIMRSYLRKQNKAATKKERKQERKGKCFLLGIQFVVECVSIMEKPWFDLQYWEEKKNNIVMSIFLVGLEF